MTILIPEPILLTILVTGANGQVGSELRDLAPQYPQYRFLFCDHHQLDITYYTALKRYFAEHKPDIVINCAAYTKVDAAETYRCEAYTINTEGAENLALCCANSGAWLLQLSTDFVFDGNQHHPYLETDTPNPQSIYGRSKYLAELMSQYYNPRTLIIRTAWVYSTYGHNFLKTMRRLAAERDALRVVSDQWGNPTYAADIAQMLLHLVDHRQQWQEHDIFHYTAQGITSWHGFAQAIMQYTQTPCPVLPITTTDYPTPARRPPYSALHCEAIADRFGLQIPHWEEALKKCIAKTK